MRKQLRAYRLARRASYERLAAEIGPDHVTARTIRRFVEGDGTTKHQELTLHAIEQFLKHQAGAGSRDAQARP